MRARSGAGRGDGEGGEGGEGVAGRRSGVSSSNNTRQGDLTAYAQPAAGVLPQRSPDSESAVSAAAAPFDPLARLTSEELSAYDETRALLHAACDEQGVAVTAWVSPACICRYLRARSFNVAKAVRMLVNTLVWRAEYGVDALTIDDLRSEIENTGKMYISESLDSEGRPIVYMKPRHDNTTDRTSKVQYLVLVLELAIRRMDAARGVETMTWIVDFADYRQLTGLKSIGTSKDTAAILQAHYPERLGRVFILNQPGVFTFFWAAVRPFVDRKTVAKIAFLKHDYAPIAAVVPLAALEEEYGGEVVFSYDVEAWLARCKQYQALPPVY